VTQRRARHKDGRTPQGYQAESIDKNTDMTRKIVQTGSSLAVTLPRDVVEQFKLKKGDEVDVSSTVGRVAPARHRL
jgi:hypothetical protein